MASEPMYKKIYDDLLNGIKEGKYPGADCLLKKN